MNTTTSRPEVRWDPSLLEAPHTEAVDAFARSVLGFARRLAPLERAKFLMALDSALYPAAGSSAQDAEGGLHPKHRLMAYHDFFVERVRMGERVVDLGCGVGALGCSIARRAGARVVGLDLSPKNLAKAQSAAAGIEPAPQFQLGDITTTRLEGRFDVVVLSNVLEHLKDRPRLLAQWQGWYSPRALLIRVPAFDRDWRAAWKRELGVEWRLDATHETEYTLEQLEQEVSEAGLRLDERIVRWGEYWVTAVAR